MTYDYLLPYLAKENESSPDSNEFWPVSESDILKSEQKLGFSFPSQLRDFYKQIGYGFLTYPHQYSSDYHFRGSNLIHAPISVADIAVEGPESGMIAESTYELLSPGDLPFFEIGDSSSFMIMKLNSDNPNAVWYMGAEKIEDSLEKFIWNLYYDDPSYYTRNW